MFFTTAFVGRTIDNCLETIFRLSFNLRGPREFGPWTSAVLIATAAVLERPASSNQNYGCNGRDRVVRQTKANLLLIPLPVNVAERLKFGGSKEPSSFASETVIGVTKINKSIRRITTYLKE